jgi:hypothetical protein
MSAEKNSFDRLPVNQKKEQLAAFYEARKKELQSLFPTLEFSIGFAGIYITNGYFTKSQIDQITGFCEQWRLTYVIEARKGYIDITVSKNVLDL